MSFIAMMLYAPRYCLTASAGFGQQSKDCMPSVSHRSTLFASMATVNRRHFRRFVLFQSTRNKFRWALSILSDNQSTSFKDQAAQQFGHREAMAKLRERRQIKLACFASMMTINCQNERYHIRFATTKAQASRVGLRSRPGIAKR